MADFDPYHKWLGISPKDQPPHHYRLLGVDLFEADPDVIDAAANKQMAFLQSCSTGPKLVFSQRLLNEIAAARLCLLNARQKTAYDANLRSQLAEQELRKSASVSRAESSQETVDEPEVVKSQFDFDTEEPFEIHDLVREASTGRLSRITSTHSFVPKFLVGTLLVSVAVGLAIRFGNSNEKSAPDDEAHRESAFTAGPTSGVSSAPLEIKKEPNNRSIRTESDAKVTVTARPPVRYEAEKARLGGLARTGSISTASGRRKVGKIDSPDSFVEFSVQAVSAGNHRLAVRYSNATSKNPTATHRVSVNGQSAGTISYPTTGNWWGAFSTAAIIVDLQTGTNTVRFSKGDHFAEIDYVEVSENQRQLTTADVVGVWRHKSGTATPGEITLLANGKINDVNGKNTWSLQGTTLRLRWPNSKAPGGEWIDTVVVAEDGKTYEGANQRGIAVSGEKVRQ